MTPALTPWIASLVAIAAPLHSERLNAAQRRAVDIVRKLDVTSFPNSIGPRRQAGKTTLRDYGFRTVALLPGGVRTVEKDLKWEIDIETLIDLPTQTKVCISDYALNGGTYNARSPRLVDRSKPGLYTAAESSGTPSCPNLTPPRLD